MLSMLATGGVKNVIPPSSGIPDPLLKGGGVRGEPWFPGAKHLVAGNPLEPSLPLTNGNTCEELG